VAYCFDESSRSGAIVERFVVTVSGYRASPFEIFFLEPEL
jgi:hypothetical protein